MRFELINLADPSRFVRVNLWNWQPTVEIIRHLGVLDENRLQRMRVNQQHVRVNADEAHTIADTLRRKVCAELTPGQRVTPDLRITSESADFDWEHPEEECSASYEWLQQFVEFCRNSQGFEVN